MSKELNLIDAAVTESAEIVARPELINLDDLALALVGGGEAAVVF